MWECLGMRETYVYLGAVVCVLVAVSLLDWLTLVCGRGASLVISCGVGADWIEEHLPNLVPQPVLDLLREECENPEQVGVVV